MSDSVTLHPKLPLFSAQGRKTASALATRPVPALFTSRPPVNMAGDSVHFSGEKISRFKKWAATYALALTLIPTGVITTGVGINAATSHPPGTSTPITVTANPEDMAHPIERPGAPEAPEAPAAEDPAPLRAGQEITPERALEITGQGHVVSIERGGTGQDGIYNLTVEDKGENVTVHVTLTDEQYEELQTVQAFGPAEADPLNSETPPELPLYATQLVPRDTLAFARHGMVLSIQQIGASTNTNAGGGIGGAGAADNSPPSTAAEGAKDYVIVLTDGKDRIETSVSMTDAQAKLVTDTARENVATYTGTRTTGGGVDGSDIFLILQGLGLIGGGAYAGRRKKRQEEEKLYYRPPTKSSPPSYNEGARAFAESSPPPAAAPVEQKMPKDFNYPTVTMDDVVGLSKQTKEDVGELLEILNTDQSTMDNLGIEPIKGALLYGPPGTGKTFLAEAIAHATGRIYKCISASSLKTQQLKGDGIGKVKKEFEAVRAAAKTGRPILLQIDEIDGLFTNREKADDEDAGNLNAFLTEIDRLNKENPNVVILYTTNHLKKLDGAAIRNGRIDYKIKMPLPATKEQRLEILELYTQKPKPRAMNEDADLDLIAEKTMGFSPVDLKSLMNKASIRAKRNGHSSLHQQDLLEAMSGIDRQRKKDGGTLTSVERPVTTFDDLGGLDEIIPKFREIARKLSQQAESQDTPLTVKEEEDDFGMKPILLEGSSGTGKTELARALANEAKCNFIAVNGSEFEDGIIGHGAANVRKLFEDARENAPTILFIDEADAAFGRRAAGGGHRNEEREATLNQLLTEINGLTTNDGVFVVAATNRPDIFDPAALSRFESVSVPKPAHPTQRLQILQVMTRKRKLAPDVKLEDLAADTQGYSGRDLKSLIQLATRQRRNAGRVELNRDDFDNAIDIFELGEKSVYPGSERDLKLVGIHEIIGHGLLTMALKRRFPDMKVRAVTMEARRPKEGGQVLGFVRPFIPEGIAYSSMACYLGQILLSAGGRASERVILGEEQPGSDTAGGGSDYQKIEQTIIHMLQSGMIPGFSPNHFAKSKQELAPDEREVVDYIIGQAEKFSEELIRVAANAYPQKLTDLVNNGIAAKTVRNEQAEALFTDVLNQPADWEPLYEVVDRYIKTVIDHLNQKARDKQSQFLQKKPPSSPTPPPPPPNSGGPAMGPNVTPPTDPTLQEMLMGKVPKKKQKRSGESLPEKLTAPIRNLLANRKDKRKSDAPQ